MSKEFQRMQQLAGINEIKINKPSENYKAIASKYTIPAGWTEVEPEQYDGDENEKIMEFFAPMDGWDPNHNDIIFIEKTPKNKFLVDGYIAFGGFGVIELNTFKKAIIKAIEIMNDIKEGWDDEGWGDEEYEDD
jgi:hypothetical protein